MRSALVPLLALLALASCSRAPAPPPRRVILVTCDTLRADRLGVYGYARPTSPNVDAFAKDGVVFDEAYTTIPITGPALSALHTGRLPDELGLAGGNAFLLGAQATTLAEVLRAAGVRTGAVVSNWVLRAPAPGQGDAGVQQGFEHFDDRMEAREGVRDSYERLAADTTDAALRWLDARAAAGDAHVFLWAHYQDPHGPYRPAPEMLAGLERPSTNEPDLPLGTTRFGKGQIPRYQDVDGERAPERYRMRYDGEVRSFDAHFGRLVAWLKSKGWYDDALIVFTADHGESLGEHGYWFCHGENVYREEARVPLVVKYPRGAARPEAQRVRELATHLDLWPTVLEAFALPARPNRGTSLLAAALPADRVASQVVRAPRTPDRWVAATDGRWRMVQEGASAPRLFDLAADPGEEHDLAAAQPERVLELARRVQQFTAAHASAPIAPVRLLPTSENQRALQHTGYTGDDEH